MKSINLRKAIGKILSDSMWSGFIISHLIVIITFAAYAVNRHVAYTKLQSNIIELQKEKIALLEGNNLTKPKEKLLKVAELESVELGEIVKVSEIVECRESV